MGMNRTLINRDRLLTDRDELTGGKTLLWYVLKSNR